MMASMADQLVSFLRARLDEDEQAARRACEYGAQAEWQLNDASDMVLCWPPEPEVAENERRLGVTVTADQWRGMAIDSPAMASHIARHDPARVLREVEAKRQLITEHYVTQGVHEGRAHQVCTRCSDYVERGELARPEVAPCRTLRLLALPYADHEDYREEWRP
jgi:hypothetical protein